MADIQRELKLPLAFPPEVEAAALQARLAAANIPAQVVTPVPPIEL